jgi:hypothetical protein
MSTLDDGRVRFTVWRAVRPGHPEGTPHIEWLVLDELEQYTVATCASQAAAALVAHALNA